MKTAASRYTELESIREPFLNRAISCASLTLPYLVPPKGHTSSQALPVPNQSLGARGVKNIVSRLTITMFPPNTPFLKYVITDADIEKMAGTPDVRSDFEKAFAKIERNITQEIEGRMLRPGLEETLNHLTVGGNCLINVLRKRDMKVYGLNKYVTVRDGLGNSTEHVIKEMVSESSLIDRGMSPPDHHSVEGEATRKADKSVECYTWIRLVGKKWQIHQEAWDTIVPGSEGSEPKDKPTWLALRLYRVDGEDYGRGFVEEQYGDLSSYDQLCKVALEAFAVFAKIIYLVKPNAHTKPKDLSAAENGDFVTGSENDIHVLTSNGKINEIGAITQYIEKLANELKYSFLMHSAIQRPGERVTAEEIRTMAHEIENAIGSVYVLLSQELQLQLVRIISDDMARTGRLPKLPSDVVRPTIITGIEALGRGNDLAKLGGFLEDMAKMNGLPPELLARLNIEELIKRVAVGRGIDTLGLIKDEQQVQAEMQAAQQQAQLQAMAPNMINAGGKIAQESMKQNG